MAQSPAQRLAPTRAQPPVGFDQVQLARELIAEALRQVRAGRTAEAAACLTAHGEIALSDDFACNLLGLIHASRGEHQKALDAFERALRIRPGRIDVLANRAITLQHLGRLEAALACYDEIVRAQPDDAQMLFQRGAAAHLLGRSDAALADYERALALKPAHAEALAGRAMLLHQRGRHEEALACYDKAILLDPTDASSHYNRGNALRELARPDEALSAFGEALRLRPAYPEALCGCAMVLNEKGKYAEALACCARALRHAPTHFPALFNQANILYAAGRIEEACATYDAVIRLKPGDADALSNRAAALLEACRCEEALTSCDRALAIKPDFPEALSNRGNILQKLQRFEEALEAYEAALALRPAYLDVLCSRGVALKQVGRYAEALASFDAALALQPDHAHTQNNRGALLLLLGDFERGWDAYESRWLKENLPVNALPRVWPEWTGGPIAGRRILVLDEQGLGDVIQFSRYLSLLVEAGAGVGFHCRKSMHRLLSTLPGAPRLIEAPEADESYDCEAALVSLPRAFKTRGDTIPATIPYLRAEEALVAKWGERIGSAGFRIGISWQGSPNPKADMARAMPLRSFAPLARIPGVRLISLQKNGGVDQLADDDRGFAVEELGPDFDAGPDAFVDTAAVMANLDLIITCDTSIAHLAGALGKPVWVALKSVPDWRFLLEREDTPWYPNMRLFRQRQRGEWNEVFARMAHALDELTRPNPKPAATALRIPGAVGELIDKITILEIKAAHIGEAGKLRNVQNELDQLRELRDEGAFTGPRLEALTGELKSVNQTLWDIEDAIRVCEQRGEFGEEFIGLARSVYKTNDRRAALKRDINLLFNSTIIEEKSYSGG